ncbi:MAG TPA: SPOR domain-containing protein [Candidatus Angelobacter sp.]|jgi:cell division septation protein DedD|nr:SPOR domain-containing protein [Candidatus Angelobacter sp.]
MSYDFSFSAKSVILIIVGCVAIGVLLFVAGFIIGLDKGQSLPATETNLSRQNQSEPKTRSEKDSTASSPESSAVPKPEQHSGAEAEKPATEKSPASEKSKETQAAPEAPQAAKASKEGGAKAEAKAEGKDQDKEKAEFSLQLGAFQTEENALKLRDVFKAKGYSVFLFRVLDGDGHLWHTVRMGHYGDMKEANLAAEKITTKEQVSAWVRPANAF